MLHNHAVGCVSSCGGTPPGEGEGEGLAPRDAVRLRGGGLGEGRPPKGPPGGGRGGGGGGNAP